VLCTLCSISRISYMPVVKVPGEYSNIIEIKLYLKRIDAIIFLILLELLVAIFSGGENTGLKW